MKIAELLIAHIPSWPVAITLICTLLRKQLRSLLEELAALIKRSSRLSLKHGDTVLEAGNDTAPQDRDAEKPKDLALGAGTALAEPTAEVDTADIGQARKNLREFASGFATVRMRDDLIRSELKALKFTIPDDELTTILIRQVAGAQSSANFEKTYRLIFGSQISSLEYLNRNGPQPLSLLKMFFESARSESPEYYADRTFEHWLSFLLNASLITTDGQEIRAASDEQTYGLSHLGRDFLLWIVYEGLTPRRAL